MSPTDARFVGFFPKLTAPAPDWLGNEQVQEIASVSTCISKAPEGWIEHWKHNDLGFFDSEALAREAAEGAGEPVDLYAYKLFPFSWLDDEEKTIDLAELGQPLPEDYPFLGYDIVTKSSSSFFECSPLSCNGLAKEYEVNTFCLIAELDAAYRALREISREGACEPGPYYLFEVYRKERQP